MNILIVRLSAIGDVIHGLPAAALLKRRLPGCTISWACEPAAADLLRGNPAVDRVVLFEGKQWIRQCSGIKDVRSMTIKASSFRKELSASRFDMAIDMQGLFKSALICGVSGASIRVGFAGTREFAEHFLTHRLDVGDYFGPSQHIVDLNVRLAQYAADIAAGLTVDHRRNSTGSSAGNGAQFPLPVPPLDSFNKVEALLSLPPEMASIPNTENGNAHKTHSNGLYVLIPGTTWSSKIWPRREWVKLAAALIESHRAHIALIGGPSEAAENEKIAFELGSIPGARVSDLTSQTSLLDLIGIFKTAKFVIGGDTGPLHLAAATGVPKVIGIYGSTPWQRNGPYGESSKSVALKLPCQPCFRKVCPLSTTACLNDLSAESVLEQVSDFLKSI